MEINGDTRLIGLIGNPVEHTLSPVIHNGISEVMSIESVYVPFRVEAEGLKAAIRGAYELNVLGMNVTVPHKNAVLDCLVDVDYAAKMIGAVNTLVRQDALHGYKGYNTDVLGLRRQILEDKIPLSGKTVVILGAGGAAKAVVYMCLLEGAKKIYLLNRTVERARQIAEHMNGAYLDLCKKEMEQTKHWKEDASTEIAQETEKVIPMALTDYQMIDEDDLIVFQATSIGLSPNVEDVVIDDKVFYQKIKYGVDLIYNPANTKFMQLVAEQGGKAYNALKMLLYQGVIAYELWHDIKVPQDVIDEIYVNLKRKVYEKNNLVLIGFMGSGKTTFGKACAERLHMNFLDADEYIVEYAGKSIPEIFAQDGEKVFRKMETEVLQYLRDTLSNTVLATGGGMPLLKENAGLLKEIGMVGYLTATPKEIYHRVKGDENRPLLQGENPYKTICDLMKQREPLYEQAADVVIDTNSNDIERIVDDMEKLLCSK